jgi:hypothetical protein
MQRSPVGGCHWVTVVLPAGTVGLLLIVLIGKADMLGNTQRCHADFAGVQGLCIDDFIRSGRKRHVKHAYSLFSLLPPMSYHRLPTACMVLCTNI